MKISQLSHWSNQSHKRESSNDLDEKFVQRHRLAKRILNESISKSKHDKHLYIDPLADLLPHDQAVLADSADASLFREKLQSKKSDFLKRLRDEDELNETSNKSSDTPVLPSPLPKSDQTGIDQPGSYDNSANSKFNLESTALKKSNLQKPDNAEIVRVELDIQFSAADIVNKMIDMGSLIGTGRSDSAITQLQKELDALVSMFSSYDNFRNELTTAEKENIESSVDFLQGYCEVSKLGDEERIRLNEQFSLLRENLNFNVQSVSTQLQNSQTQIESPVSITNVRAKSAQLSLNKLADSNYSESYAVIEKNRRLLQSKKEDKKQSEDTLALKVQRSV